MENSSVSMKLLIDPQSKKVLFAEAGKDCVDFLFYILSLPVATLISLVGKQDMVGSLANLYESIENMNESYIQPNQTKDKLLKPVYPVTGSCLSLLATHGPPADQNKFYRCMCTHSYYEYEPNLVCDDDFSHVANDSRAICPRCGNCMDKLLQYVEYHDAKQMSSSGDGFVKGVVTYMVMDDLVVRPMSTISTITLLNKFNIKDVGALEEKVVHVDMIKAVKLLKSSLETKNVLTHVFK